jgi:hypothetical protein
MSLIGNVLSQHRKNAALSIVSILFGLLVAVVGIFLLVVVRSAPPEARGAIGATALVATILGIAIVALGWYLRGRGSFTVGDQGVLFNSPKGTREVAYRDIAETCQMYRSGISVGLAFRPESQTDWVSATAHLAGYRKFRQQVMDGYIRARLPLLLDRLHQGQTLTFKIATMSGKLQKAFSTGVHAYVHVDTDNVFLTSRTLTFNGHSIDIAGIREIDLSNWTENIRFMMANGEKETLSFTALFEADLLLALLESLRS